MNQGENIISRLSAPQYDTRGMALLGQNFQSAMKSGSDLLNEYGKKQAENLANAKASELMANGDIKSLQQASPLLAYASEPMQKQAQSLLGSLQADRSYGLQERAANLADNEFAYKQQHDADLISMNKDQFNKKYGLDLDELSFKKSQAAIQNGISAQELLLRKNEAKRLIDKDAEAKKAWQIQLNNVKQYNEKGKVIGEVATPYAFNPYTMEYKPLLQSGGGLPPLK